MGFLDADASHVCRAYLGMAPRVVIDDKSFDTHHLFRYIPNHLHHMLFELLKNSMRGKW